MKHKELKKRQTNVSTRRITMDYKVVEQLDDTQSAIHEHIKDINDIERMIDELNKKKSTIVHRLTKKSDKLKSAINDGTIVGILTRDAILAINKLITDCDNYIRGERH